MIQPSQVQQLQINEISRLPSKDHMFLNRHTISQIFEINLKNNFNIKIYTIIAVIKNINNTLGLLLYGT